MIGLHHGDRLRLTIDPARGAGVRSLEWRGEAGSWVPVLQAPAPDNPEAAGSAMFPMVPFANRARGNALIIGDRRIDLAPNWRDPLAIHGWGWQRGWRVVTQGVDHCTLALDPDPALPVRFAAELTVALAGETADFGLAVTNPGHGPIPAGLGFHPWFPHLPGTGLCYSATHFWLEGPGTLPTEALRMPPELDHTTMRPVPGTWRDNCLSGWDGSARIDQPDLGYSLTMTAALPFLMLHVPPSGPFALEPQSHLSGRTEVGEGGLATLDPGGRLEAVMRLRIAG